MEAGEASHLWVPQQINSRMGSRLPPLNEDAHILFTLELGVKVRKPKTQGRASPPEKGRAPVNWWEAKSTLSSENSSTAPQPDCLGE